jgi:hypothetical protein
MADKYLTFRIASTNQINHASTNGTLTITGPFDVGFGFVMVHSTVGKSHFAAEGARLDSPKPENKSTVFTVSIKEKVPPQTYYLKFQDLNSLNWDSNVKGSINLSDLAVVEHLPV